MRYTLFRHAAPIDALDSRSPGRLPAFPHGTPERKTFALSYGKEPPMRVSRSSASLRFELKEFVTVRRLPAAGRGLDVWCPAVGDTPYQRVLEMKVNAVYGFALGFDPEYGNALLHARVSGPLPHEVKFEVRYRIERRPFAADPEADRMASPPGSFFSRHLRAHRYAAPTTTTADLARRIVGDEADPFEQARALHRYVCDAVRIDPSRASGLGSVEHALQVGAGSSEDVTALFVCLCRSVGIPAKFVTGLVLDSPVVEDESYVAGGGHAWAEFFAPGFGWTPADPTCECRYRHPFARLETNHVALSVGRDLRLEPPQAGERLLSLAGPYAEVDARPHADIARRLTFRAFSASPAPSLADLEF